MKRKKMNMWLYSKFLFCSILAFSYSHSNASDSDVAQIFRDKVRTFNENPEIAVAAVNSLSGRNNKTESKESESATLGALAKMKNRLNKQSLLTTHQFSVKQAKDKSRPLVDRVVALRVADKMLKELAGRDFAEKVPKTLPREDSSKRGKKESQGAPLFHDEDLLTPETDEAIKSFRVQLRGLALDNSEDNEIRYFAVRSLGQLGNEEDQFLLRVMANNHKKETPLRIQKEALLSLNQLQDKEVVLIASELLRIESDTELTKAAAYILGQADTDSALAVLIDNMVLKKNTDERPSFESGIFQHKEKIENHISTGTSEQRKLALKALEYIQWGKEDRYKVDMKNLLKKLDPLKENEEFGETLKRLVEAKLESNDCTELLASLNQKGVDARTLYPKEFAYFSQYSQWVSIQSVGKVEVDHAQ